MSETITVYQETHFKEVPPDQRVTSIDLNTGKKYTIPSIRLDTFTSDQVPSFSFTQTTRTLEDLEKTMVLAITEVQSKVAKILDKSANSIEIEIIKRVVITKIKTTNSCRFESPLYGFNYPTMGAKPDCNRVTEAMLHFMEIFGEVSGKTEEKVNIQIVGEERQLLHQEIIKTPKKFRLVLLPDGEENYMLYADDPFPSPCYPIEQASFVAQSHLLVHHCSGKTQDAIVENDVPTVLEKLLKLEPYKNIKKAKGEIEIPNPDGVISGFLDDAEVVIEKDEKGQTQVKKMELPGEWTPEDQERIDKLLGLNEG